MNSTTATQVIEKAASQIGGYYPSSSPYGVWYGSKVGDPRFATASFCAMGLSWCFGQFLNGLDIFPRHAYTPSGVSVFKARGQWCEGLLGVMRGDVVYFDFPGFPDRISHVGIVESVNSDGSVNTIEFNTSTVFNGSQYNGRTVARKRRKSYIVGYGRPTYGIGVTSPDGRHNADGSLRLSLDGRRGPATIARWQAVMGTTVDGKISSPSNVVRADQEFLNSVIGSNAMYALIKKTRLSVDGYEGPNTFLARQYWLRMHAVSKEAQLSLTGDLLALDGSFGPKSIKVFQYALNNAQSRSGRY